MRPGIFVSRTREKLGRTCDQIGRTLEPCHSPRRRNSAYTSTLFQLCRLKRASLPPPILTTYYRGTIESVLTSCITVWYGNCSAADRKTLQRTVNTSAKIIGASLPSTLDIVLAQFSSKANYIMKDPTYPSNSLFQLLQSGRRYRSIRAYSARLLNSFFPQAVRALNSTHSPLSETPIQTPYLLKHGSSHTHPNLTTSRKKTLTLFCAIRSVLHTGEWACTNHL